MIPFPKRKEVLLGTNQFPNFNEKAGEKNPVEANAAAAVQQLRKAVRNTELRPCSQRI